MLRKGHRVRRIPALGLLALGVYTFLCLADEPPGTEASTPVFTNSVQPFFAKNCYACHNAKLKIGGLNLEAYASAPPAAPNRDEFKKILQKLEAGEMPPKTQSRPSQAELDVVAKWIQARFRIAAGNA